MACPTQTALVADDSCTRLMDSCREFCLKRQRDAEEYRSELAKRPQENKKTSYMDLALEKLRKDMANVVEQDIHLLHLMMKMGDTIETIKQHTFDYDYDSSDDETDDEEDYEDDEEEFIQSSRIPSTDLCSCEEEEVVPNYTNQLYHHVVLCSKDDDADNSADDSGYYGDSSDEECSDAESEL